MSKTVILASFFDGGMAFGPRSLYATLRHRGIPVKLLHFGLTGSFPDHSGFRLLQCRYHINSQYVEPIKDSEYDECIDTIRRQDPLLVGLSVDSRVVPFARVLTERLARDLPEVPVIWGGIHPTVDPDHSLQFVDTICVGEGEETLVEIARRLERGNRDFSDIPNLMGVGPDGARYSTPLRLIADLDSLPVPLVDDRDHLYVPADIPERIASLKRSEGKAIYEAYNTLASRGCPFSCTYCYSQAVRTLFKGCGTNFLRRRGVEHVLRELKAILARTSYPFIAFWDDMFDNDEVWLEEFTRRYKQEIGLPYGMAMHTHLVTERIVKLLKDSGCHSVGVGIQTGSARINRDIYKRPFNRERVLKAVALLNANFDTFYDLILENPYETEEDILETIELFREFPHPFMMSANTLLWFSGQAITTRALLDGKIAEQDVLGHHPDGAEAYRDITHPKYGADPAARRRYSLYLIAFAMQHPALDRDKIAAEWTRDDALLDQPHEIERRLALLYLNESESDLMEVQAQLAEKNAIVAGLRKELEQKSHCLVSARSFL